MYLKILQNVAALVTFQNRPSALRREENKVKFLEEQFRNEKLSFAHKKKTEPSFELFLITCKMNWNLTPSSLSKIRLLAGNKY